MTCEVSLSQDRDCDVLVLLRRWALGLIIDESLTVFHNIFDPFLSKHPGQVNLKQHHKH